MKENNFINSDKIYLFHNNRCSKSREVKKYLDDNNIIYEVIDYINILPQESFLKGAISKLENNFQEIIRVNEKIYKNLNDNEKIHAYENIIHLVMKYPILLQRPIVSIERNKKIIQSIICRPTELIKSIFN
jgi:arsenate reductase